MIDTKPDRTYRHLTCDTTSDIPEPVLALYQKQPELFEKLDCEKCFAKFPRAEFVWEKTKKPV